MPSPDTLPPSILPVSIPRYIQLDVAAPLNLRQQALWRASVRDAAPSGVVATVQTTDPQGTLRSVCMVHQECRRVTAGATKTPDGATIRHGYRIPLTRDLLPEEVQRIVAVFAQAAPDLDFDVETNITQLSALEPVGISVDDARQLALCTAMAKARHAGWMRQKLDAGWRFGVHVSTEARTHPLLRPWEQLPDQFRKPDLAGPQAVFDLIQDQGYVIIGKDALDQLLARQAPPAMGRNPGR